MFGEIPYQQDDLKKPEIMYSVKWFEKYPFLEYSLKIDWPSVLPVACLGMEQDPRRLTGLSKK